MAGEESEPNILPPVVPVALGVEPKPVERDVDKPEPNPVEPNGFAVDNGDCVVVCAPKIDWPVVAG